MAAFLPGEQFRALHAEVLRCFFSRDEKLWPLLGAPEVKAMLAEFASQQERKREGDDPDTKAVVEELKAVRSIPEGGCEEACRRALERTVRRASLDSIWATPRSAENVATLPCDPGIVGAALCNVANPNLVHHEYSPVASDLEDAVLRQVATLAGMDPARAGGLFTSGGTMANLYGLLIALRKAFPSSLQHGAPPHNYRFLSSFAGHYSNVTALRTLGVNTERGTLRVPINDANEIDCAALSSALEACFRLGVTVPAILLTMGTTDTFATDDVRAVREAVDRACALHGVALRPHIHVDAAVGWAACFLNDYDVQRNELGITACGRDAVRWLQSRFRYLHLADSFSADLHKLGYCPYPSSIFLVREATDLNVLRHDSNLFTYFKAPSEGHELFRVTVECSRSAVGVYSASLALDAMGRRGYQSCLANAIQNAGLLRALLRGDPEAAREAGCPEALALRGRLHVVPSQGPTVAIRAYERAVLREEGAAPGRYVWECEEGGLLLDAHAVCLALASGGRGDSAGARGAADAVSAVAEVAERAGGAVAARLKRRARKWGKGPRPLFPSNLFQEGAKEGGGGPAAAEEAGRDLAQRIVDASRRGDEAEVARYTALVGERWAAYEARTSRSSAFHRAVFKRRAHGGLFCSWVDAVTHSRFSSLRGSTLVLPGEKMVFFNPRTSPKEVVEYVRALKAAIEAEDAATHDG